MKSRNEPLEVGSDMLVKIKVISSVFVYMCASHKWSGIFSKLSYIASVPMNDNLD